MSDEFCKDHEGRSIFLADQTKVTARARAVERILGTIAPFMGWKDGGRHVWVSDESTLSDFGLGPEEINKISCKLGVDCAKHDYICEIAERLEPRVAEEE